MKKLKALYGQLSKKELQSVFGGNYEEGGPCRNAYPQQPAGCVCQRDNQCAKGLSCSGPAPDNSGWWKGTCAKKPELTDE